MPLLVDEKPVESVPRSVTEFFWAHPNFKQTAAQFHSKSVQTVGPVGLLYIGQRELAAVSSSDNVIKVLGTEDATTCHIAVLKHTGSGATCLTHFDGCSTKKGIANMVSLLTELSVDAPLGRFELHMFGGFQDDRNTSSDLSIKILNEFNNRSENFHLLTACITDLNDVVKNKSHWPVIYGLAVIVETGEIFPATFSDKGPDQPLRSARHFTGSDDIMNIYDNQSQELVVGPFHYSTMDEIDLLCRLPDEFIRKHLSTSPEQEPPQFEANVRSALVQIRDHPDPMKTVFRDGKSRRYKKESDGSWTRV
ncbi:hypothetical protein ScPMuIL_005078 [Solemya velum]